MKRYAWKLPGGGRLVLRQLTTPQLDNLAVRALETARGNAFQAQAEEKKLGLIDSLLEINGSRASSNKTTEELYHELSAREREFASLAWDSIHDAPRALLSKVLATHETTAIAGEHRWQANVTQLEELKAEKAAAPDEATSLSLGEDIRRVQAHGWIIMREITGTDVDQVGSEVFGLGGDVFGMMAAEQRKLVERSLVQVRGERKAGSELYQALTPVERAIVRRAYEQINEASAEEIESFLGTREVDAP